ncbi:hypothetical protein DVH24_000074 [Malus domestica]|uniref:Uncharacterized protein n=1 Tax=Malus domestica TaxID=3750 RepID=A0A498J1E4_MALDO|nr:hypothetical protein DVH24_000074 [Malus domestica]
MSFRKQLSGNMKRKKKAKDNEIAESLRGSLNKFFSTKNESVENLRENDVSEESQNVVGESHDHEIGGYDGGDLEENVGDESQDHKNVQTQRWVQARFLFTAVGPRTRIMFYSTFYTMAADHSGSLCVPVIDDVKLLSVRKRV